MNYLEPTFTEAELARLSNLALAHVGDGVFELMTRVYLAAQGRETARGLHRATVQLVNAPSQAKMIERLLPRLTEEELTIFRRGRNARVGSVPKAASVKEYHEATGLEALFGWLYLKGERARLEALFALAMEEN